MLKSLRKKFRKITFQIESIFLSHRLINYSRPINVVRAWKSGRVDLAHQIINKKSIPLNIKLSNKNENKTTTFVTWKALNSHESEFLVDFDQSEEILRLIMERTYHIFPLIFRYHKFHFFRPGSIQINLGDFAEADGLAFCSNREEQLLIPDDSFIRTEGYQDIRRYFKETFIPWKKRKPIFFWRGSTTGISPTGLCRDLQRVRLCEIISHQHNKNIFDIGFSGIVQINKDDARQLEKQGYLKPFMPITNINTYKFHIDIDGNSNAWSGLFQKLLSGGLVFKVESEFGFRQWYYDRLIPWQHYIPIKKDLSDFLEKVDWAFSNDRQSQEIALAGSKFAFDMTYEAELDKAIRLISNNIK